MLVVRPDSGDPLEVVVDCLNLLGDRFGYTTNAKGYKVLPDYVRLIQGDGIDRESLPQLVWTIARAGWSLDNIVFGSGGGLLTACNRDTQRFAMKCSWVNVMGEERDVFKEPATDPSKNSKRGKLKLVLDGGRLTTVSFDDPHQDQLREVFRNGRVLLRTSLEEIRGRSTL